jgi:hypothetical protein
MSLQRRASTESVASYFAATGSSKGKKDDEIKIKTHPFVKLIGFIGSSVTKGAERRAEAKEQKRLFEEAEEEERKQEALAQGKRYKKSKGKSRFARLNRLAVWRRKGAADDDDDSSDDDEDQTPRQSAEDWWEGDVSGQEDSESEDWDPNEDVEDWEEQEGESFRIGKDLVDHPNFIKEWEPIERLGPLDLQALEETMWKMQPKYKKAENMILEEEMERAVDARLKRLKRANTTNAVLAFGAPKQQAPANLGNIKVPTLIYVTGHHGLGGNVGVNGVYERYPDNYHGRPVYQKYLDRDAWTLEPQEVEFTGGERAYAMQDLDDEEGGRTFPSLHDTPRTKLAMKHTMVASKVLACQKEHGAVGDFRFVDKAESWFIFFDDYQGAWCIGPQPGSNAVFARCFGVDEALPDNLGPEAWQVFDVGNRIWHTHKNLRTIKGGRVSSAIC